MLHQEGLLRVGPFPIAPPSISQGPELAKRGSSTVASTVHSHTTNDDVRSIADIRTTPISIRVGFVAATSPVIATLPTMQYQPLARPKKRMQGKHETLNSSKFTHVDEAGLHCHNELRNQAHTIALREDISARHFRTSSGCTTPFTQQNNSPLDLSPICTLGCQLGPE